MTKKQKIYTAKELQKFPYISTTLHDMDREDGSIDMIREWQKWAFKKVPKGLEYEPVEAIDGDIRDRITISIPRFQLLRLKEAANTAGIPYQTYLNHIIKQNIDHSRAPVSKG